MNQQSRFRQSVKDVASLKASLRTAWNTGGAGYQELAEGLRPAVEHLLRLTALEAGQLVLDAATGTGLAALAAAERGAQVTAVDFAPDLLAEGERLAQVAGLSNRVAFELCDCEALPYADASFDVVISTFGVMFTARHDAVAYELARVLKPGGTLALATWLPFGPNVELMTISAPYLPPPQPGSSSPLEWGKRAYIEDLFGPTCVDFRYAEGNAPLLTSSPEDGADLILHRALGPTIYLYRSFPPDVRLRLHADLLRLLERNRAGDGTVALRRDYLLTVATRRG